MKTTLYIQNLKCGGCVSSIINRISALEHIKNVTIKLQFDTITFEYDNNADFEEVKHILSNIGYPPFGEKNSFGKKAKSYVSCAIGRIKNEYKKN
jgi:copper chaperone CopZ